MKSYRTNRKGFTLVEILIVVIILGILAAIVIPQFTSASEDARKSSLSSQLQTLRSQVELYKLQHRDAYPTDTGLVGGVWDWDRLTAKTNEDGTKTGGTLLLGPYLQQKPVNSLNGKTDMGTAVGATIGFVIDTNGKISGTNKTLDGLAAD